MCDHQTSNDFDEEKMLSDAEDGRIPEELGGQPDSDTNYTAELLQAVPLGKVDRVLEVLKMGADPLVAGTDGRTALEVAVEMVYKYPEENNRREILQLFRNYLIQYSIKRKSLWETKCSEHAGEIKDTIGKLEGLVRTLSTEAMYFKDSTLSTSKQATAVAQIEHEDIVKKVDTIRQSVETMKREQASMVSSVNALQLAIADGRKEVASLVSTLETSAKSPGDVKGEVNGIMQSLGEIKDEVSEVKQPMEGLMGEIHSLKQSIEAFKSEVVAKVADKLTLIQTVDGNVNKILSMLHSPEKEPDIKYCTDAMMQKTKFTRSTRENKSKMRELYERVYDVDPILSSIVQFLVFHRFDVHVDFESRDIEEMRSELRDHDGSERIGSEFVSFTDFEERKVYLGGGDKEEWVAARLSRELSQLAVFLAFQNEGRPYGRDGDEEREVEFKGILKEAERKKRDGEDLNYFIGVLALEMKTQLGKEIHSYAAVPYIITRDGSSQGRVTLEDQLPSLLKFFEEHVVVTLKRQTKKVKIGEKVALQ